MNQQGQSNADTMFPGDTMHDDYVADERAHAPADQIVVCGTCSTSLDADHDMFFEEDDRAIVCLECWIAGSAQAVAS